ncbi:MAG: DUF4280 domain-containing protein [Ilumatobacteraceae bacterium]
MAQPVVNGSVLMCSFGLAPSTMMVVPTNQTMGLNQPVATIMDNKPLLNILPFGMCTTLSNPIVAAATAAALGVLTPMPCIPAVAAPWAPGAPTVLIGKMPALNNTSKCMCNWGGVISVTMSPAVTITVP